MNGDNTLYTETSGTTAYIGGKRGTVVQFTRALGRKTGAFVRLAEEPVMLYVLLAGATGSRGQWHEIGAWREINRDEFDRLTGLTEARQSLGWDLG